MLYRLSADIPVKVSMTHTEQRMKAGRACSSRNYWTDAKELDVQIMEISKTNLGVDYLNSTDCEALLPLPV